MFRQIPEFVEHDVESEIENASRDENNERQTVPHLTTFERTSGDDSENSKTEQITVRNDEPERLLDEDHDPQNESQQDSDIPTGRESRVRRLPVRFRIDETTNNQDRLWA